MLLTGLVGRPVTHSIGQTVYNRFYSESGIDSSYLAIDILRENISRFVASAKEHFLGYNVTIPHKVSIIDFLDRLDKSASEIGSVNLVRNRNGVSEGFNTDSLAMKKICDSSGIQFENAKVAVYGLGGVGRTVLHCLEKLRNPPEIYIITRDPGSVKERLPEGIGTDNIRVIGSKSESKEAFDILINCSPVGMWPESGNSPFSESLVRKCSAGIDLIYNPPETKFVGLLKKHGKPFVNGVSFFTDQGYETLRLLFGGDPDRNLFERIVENAISEVTRHA